MKINPDENYIPPKCNRCNGTGYEIDMSLYDHHEDPTACIHCSGNGALYPEPEYNDSGKFIGYNYA